MNFNLLCKFFGHKFGEWEYLADDSCKQVRNCVRDRYQESREVPHQFDEWEYLADDSCKQVRNCVRDGYEERRVFHQFGDWNYVARNSCKQVRICRRDGYQDSQEAPHQWIVSDTTTQEEEYAESNRKGGGYYDVVFEITKYRCRICGKEMVQKEEVSRKPRPLDASGD